MTKSTKNRLERRKINRKLKSAERTLKIAKHRIDAKKLELAGPK